MNTGAWITSLIRAADEDNTVAGRRCGESGAAAVLRAAPAELAGHADLALADFAAAGPAPLAMLRSDQVAARFAPVAGVSVLVARMTVPGGPWPGRFGLEAVAFTARRAVMPGWFPPAAESGLYFGEMAAASRAFRDGAGAVLFPEQLAVSVRPVAQAFGVVFIRRLAELFVDRVLPVLAPGTFSAAETAAIGQLRELAFSAHERGHQAGVGIETAAARQRRLAAVIAELHADLDALVMLFESADASAAAVARVLVADRIVREAWLRRSHAQVDAIAARQLLVLLARTGAAFLTEDQFLGLDLDAARRAAVDELARVREVERACVGSLDPAREYLASSGWTLVGTACHRELAFPLARFLAYAASRRRPPRLRAAA
jgi:hypothetical protein